MFSSSDLNQFKKLGINENTVLRQIDSLKQGFPFLKIKASAVIGNGIKHLDEKERKNAIIAWDNYLDNGSDIVKFVPASGAASRMFKDLFEFLNSNLSAPDNEYVKKFFNEIHNFAFFNALNEKSISLFGKSVDEQIQSGNYKDVIRVLLDEKGLNYGSLPKGLLLFHTYPNYIRTPFLEHIVEGALYTTNKYNEVRIHFTVLPEHLDLFKSHMMNEIAFYENLFKVHYIISFSIQKASTDTIALDANGDVVRNDDGSVLFRPAGHGALIENLNDLNSDIIFIKNIDNVVPDKFKDVTVDYKKVIAGVLVSCQEKLFNYLTILNAGKVSDAELDEMLLFAKNELSIDVDLSKCSSQEKRNFLFEKFNRPIRVCGMVKNEGEPGGGPYIVIDNDGSTSLQILESSQINKNNPDDVNIMKNSKFFNPVDIVCGVRDFNGNKFDLTKYVDEQTGFISTKSKNGVDMKVLELPGLWNGAMSNWNTIFVEVPIDTFNPVKSVNDLLREQHR